MKLIHLSVICPHCGGRHPVSISVEQGAENRKHQRWGSVNWDRPTSDIAKEMGVTQTTVSQVRRRLAPDTMQPRPKAFDWSRIDWSMRNRDIALETGKSPATVSAKRKLFSR
jgi:hypothetical protein